MNIEMLRGFFLWCAVVNYTILIVWFLALITARDFVYRLHGRWFRLTDEQFTAIHYGGMAIYKIGVLLFNVAPLIALWIIA